MGGFLWLGAGRRSDCGRAEAPFGATDVSRRWKAERRLHSRVSVLHATELRALWWLKWQFLFPVHVRLTDVSSCTYHGSRTHPKSPRFADVIG